MDGTKQKCSKKSLNHGCHIHFYFGDYIYVLYLFRDVYPLDHYHFASRWNVFCDLWAFVINQTS